MYTAETKTKLVKTTGKTEDYTYYHCTRRKKNFNCSQRKGVRSGDLELQWEKELEKYTILPEFLEWALEGINKDNDKEIEDRSKVYEMQHKSLVEAQTELDELTKMRYRKLITDESFIKERDILEAKINQLKDKLRDTEARAERWLELTDKTFKFACYARKDFFLGDIEKKKEIAISLGQKTTIKNGKLSIVPNDWFQPIKDGYPALEEEYLRLELNKEPMNTKQKDALASIRVHWGA